MEKRQIEIECRQCKGTGLYKGTCEQHGAAVVCCSCKGTGHVTMEYTPWGGELKARDDVQRVFESSHGFILSAKDEKNDDGQIVHFSQYGCTYREWLSGVKPRPVEELICPCRYNQSKATNMFGCTHKLQQGFKISSCSEYEHKAECWEKFNAQQAAN